MSLDISYEIDKSFDSDKFLKLNLRICHSGINPNNSNFEVEPLIKAEDSIKNIPILASIIIDSEGKPRFNSHDMHIEEDKLNEGEFRLIYDEQPIGVVYESAEYSIKEYNGKQYVFSECYIWRGYSNYSETLIERTQNIHLSMEIEIINYTYDSKTKIYNIKEFKYKGITLLDNSIGTGMLDALASTEVFSDNSKQKLFTLMSELKEEITKNQSSTNEVDIKTSFSKKEEGKILDQEKINELFAKYDIKLEDIDISVDNFETIEALETKLQEMNNSDYSLTASQLAEELSIQLRIEKVEDRWGDEYSRYSFYDYKDNQVFAFDRMDNWKLVGFIYSINGDSVSIDFESKKRKKIEIVDFDEGMQEDTNPIFTIIQEGIEFGKNDGVKETEDKYKDYASIKSEFDKYKELHKTPETEVEELRTFKVTKNTEDRQNAEKEVFDKFEIQLAENAEFKTLKENAKDYSIEDLADKCFSILGKVSAKFELNFEQKPKKEFVKIAVDTTDENDDTTYGGLFNQYASK